MIQPGLGYALQINPVLPGWTPATIDVFTDFGSAFHVLLGAVAASVPPDWAILILAAVAGYDATKAANGESWSRIGGVWVEFAAGMAGALVVKHGHVGALPGMGWVN